MLPLAYGGMETAAKVAEDPLTAPIPEVHKAMYRWVEKFVRHSWEMTAEDLQSLRDAGVPERFVSDWAQVACMQTWWVMMGDGGGVALESGGEKGMVVGKTRDTYSASVEGLLAAAPGGSPGNGTNGTQSAPASSSDVCWVGTDLESAEYKDAATWAENRYGFMPNFLKAVSLVGDQLPRHTRALELLERPQSETLSPRLHALVRAMITGLNRCAYSAATTHELINRTTGDTSLYEKVTGPWVPDAWDEDERTVLAFAMKAARNHYKIMSADAESFRTAGLDDAAYIDVLNTVAIQTSNDRLANSLGVAPDAAAILPKD